MRSDKEAQIASELAADVSAEEATAAPPSPSSSSSSTSSSSSSPPVDSRDAITFNLSILSDHGVVLCPGFHRADDGFTSSTLLSALKRTAAATPAEAKQFPALKATSEVKGRYSPTLLPPAPTDAPGNSGAASSTPLEELTIAFGKGAFSLVEEAGGAPAAANGSSLSVPSQSSSAAASSVLKRLSLTGWLSSPAVPAAAEGGASSASFPPSSALPPSDEQSEDLGPAPASPAPVQDEDSDDEADTPPAPPARSLTAAAQLKPAPTSNAPPASPAPATSNTVVSTTATAAPAASMVPQTPTTSALQWLPSSLWSSISWMFPLSPVTAPDPLGLASKAPPSSAATPLPPPPPPPPYHSTVRRLVIIGIHGWSLLGGMLGEKPLIISSRFCYYIQQAVLHYMHQRGVPASALHITCIPLYGHGRVEERVSMYLDTQLPQYAAELARADHVIIACHSQGCMVTSAILHILLSAPPPGLRLGVGGEDVSVLMLAGLHHGPFPDLSTDLYTSTKELFFYSHAHSQHSQQHMDRMAECIRRGVKLLLVGSVHDQVVPLYSSLAHLLGASPNLLRAMYVDYVHYQPDFLYSLLSLVLYLSNRPRPPSASSEANDVLPHISGFVRGSLLEKQGGAHSAMHRCVDVYGLGVEWAMSGRGVAEEGMAGVGGGRRPMSYSAAMWSSQLSDGFTSGRFNRHLLLLRVREMMAQLGTVDGLVEAEERERLDELFAQWQPRTKNLRLLKDTLQPVFAPHQTQTHMHSNL